MARAVTAGSREPDRAFSHAHRRCVRLLPVAVAFLAAFGTPAAATAQDVPTRGVVTGVVVDGSSLAPISGANVFIEGTDIATLTDAQGRFRLEGVPLGPQVLRVHLIGYASARIPLNVRPDEVINRRIELEIDALRMEELRVTADAVGRAEGELASSNVITEAAIDNQVAASLEGILELTPGVVLSPPGLDGVQQFSLRAIPTPSTLASFASVASGRSPLDLASFGTSIIVDGVPISNNANLQSLGPRAELFAISGSAGGGIDLRRIPAKTLERVEVIRGVPSVRWGDLTQGAVIVYTKAGEVAPEIMGQVDPRSGSGTFLGGVGWGSNAGSLTFDVTRTILAPGLRDDVGSRIAGQLAHRWTAGTTDVAGQPRLTLDGRAEFFQVLQGSDLLPDQSGLLVRDRGIQLSERLRLRLGERSQLRVTGGLSFTQQRSDSRVSRFRPALPVTNRTTEGMQEGSYLVGDYFSRIDVDGDPWQLFTRLEQETTASFAGFEHTLRPGIVLRREWNNGPGIQFDIDRPHQERFNGVQGFDRPRSWDDIPALTASAFYLDDWMTRTLFGDVRLDIQAGVRLDLLHDGSSWFSGVRSSVLQPRVTAQLTPLPSLRLRAGAGITAKLPALSDLYPAPQYYDVINVNYFANDPAERLAVLTTVIRDPTNPDLGFSRGEKLEAGFELDLGPGAGLSLAAFHDRITDGVGLRFEPDFLIRERFDVDDVLGDGIPPTVIEPAAIVDTVPILIHRPENNLELVTRGLELTASLPELAPIHTRLEVQAAWMESAFSREGLDFGTHSLWTQFQLQDEDSRSPYWEAVEGEGQQGVVTWRAIYHQPELGLVVTGVLQHYLGWEQRTVAATDTLAFAGYITRSGELVEVPPERRGDPEFSDLRRTRSGLLTEPAKIPNDWLFSLRVAKTLPLDGRLTFYAFNALDREGQRARLGFSSRFFVPLRWGLEARFPLAGVF